MESQPPLKRAQGLSQEFFKVLDEIHQGNAEQNKRLEKGQVEDTIDEKGKANIDDVRNEPQVEDTTDEIRDEKEELHKNLDPLLKKLKDDS